MKTSISNSAKYQIQILFFAFISIIITGFLLYIDEGNYNFFWMENGESWGMFLIYSLVIFLMQLAASKLFSLLFKIKRRQILSIVVGTTLGLMALIFLVFN